MALQPDRSHPLVRTLRADGNGWIDHSRFNTTGRLHLNRWRNVELPQLPCEMWTFYTRERPDLPRIEADGSHGVPHELCASIAPMLHNVEGNLMPKGPHRLEDGLGRVCRQWSGLGKRGGRVGQSLLMLRQ